MKCFAVDGVAGASLRSVAASAGVSVALVQHHFRTKASLVAAVDAELLAILRRAAPTPLPTEDPIGEIGHRIKVLVGQHPDAVDYLAHLLISNQPSGQVLFDALFDIGRSQWGYLDEQGRLPPDFDATWGALNPLMLVLGTLILRSHVERQLSGSLTSPAQLRRWETALNRLLERGQFGASST